MEPAHGGANYDDSKKVWASFTVIPLRSKRYADRKSLDNVVIFMVTRRTGYGARALQTRGCRMLPTHTEAINFAKCIEVRYMCVHSRCSNLYKIISPYFFRYLGILYMKMKHIKLFNARGFGVACLDPAITTGSSLGRYVFGSEISYNKAPPRLPGLGC